MKAFEQVVEAIGRIDSNEEIKNLIDSLVLRQTFIAKKTIRQLSIGDTVSYNGRYGFTKGRVKKINVKYVVVDTPKGSWRVPAYMLRKEAEHA